MNATRFFSTSNNKRNYSKSKFAKAKKARNKVSDFAKIARQEAFKIVRSMAEVKQTYARRTFECYNLQPTSASSNIVNHYQALTPNNDATNGLPMVLGASADTRIGNEITPKRAWFKYVVTQNPYNASTNQKPQPYIIRFWIFSIKESPFSAPIADQIYDPSTGDFFKDGATVQNMRGTVADLISNVNTEAYRLYGYFDVKCGFAQTNPNGTDPNYQYFSNNDFALSTHGTYDITKFLPKKMKFNNDLDDEVKTPTIWVMWNCMPAAGYNVASSQLPIQVDISSTFEYYDM